MAQLTDINKYHHSSYVNMTCTGPAMKGCPYGPTRQAVTVEHDGDSVLGYLCRQCSEDQES